MAGSCIGVIALVMVLEALRRASREYDAYIVRSFTATSNLVSNTSAAISGSGTVSDDVRVPTSQANNLPKRQRRFTPNLFQQIVRAILHMLQFAVAYFIMLLAMYFNGYVIICIFIGAFLGAFVFNWYSMSLP